MATSGHVRNIRAATETDQLDLKGVDPAQATDLVQQAFTDPLPTTNFIRISLVTGAGKLGRQKYHPDLAKSLTAALRELGYDEDQGASACAACQGTFKSQHDTGRNLLLLHVFPKVTEAKETDGAAGGGGGGGVLGAAAGGGGDGGDDWRDMSPVMMAATAKMSTFEKMFAAKCASWTQRKRLLEALKDLGRQLRTCDEKLIAMEKLTEEEERLYDATTTDELSEKVVALQADIKSMVAQGKLTKQERDSLIDQVKAKLGDAAGGGDGDGDGDGDGGAAAAGGDDKETAALRKRLAKLSMISPITHPLKQERELLKLFSDLLPLEKLENTSRLLDAAEMRQLGRKGDIEDEIDAIACACRGWFETDDEIDARVRAVKARAKPKAAKKGGKKSSSGWGTVGGSGRGGGAGKKRGGGGGGGGKKGGSAFAGLMDSDSD
eukprot:g474.t1